MRPHSTGAHRPPRRAHTAGAGPGTDPSSWLTVTRPARTSAARTPWLQAQRRSAASSPTPRTYMSTGTAPPAYARTVASWEDDHGVPALPRLRHLVTHADHVAPGRAVHEDRVPHRGREAPERPAPQLRHGHEYHRHHRPENGDVEVAQVIGDDQRSRGRGYPLNGDADPNGPHHPPSPDPHGPPPRSRPHRLNGTRSGHREQVHAEERHDHHDGPAPHQQHPGGHARPVAQAWSWGRAPLAISAARPPHPHPGPTAR